MLNFQNYLFAYDNLKNNLPSSLRDSLTIVDSVHKYETRSVTYKQFKVPSVRTQIYGVNSIKSKSVNFWNYINKHFHYEQLDSEKRSFCKSFVTKFIINGYE